MKSIYANARMAVAFLEVHDLEPTGENFEVAYDIIANPTTEFARAIAVEVDDGLRLTPEGLANIQERFDRTPRKTDVATRERSVEHRASRLDTLTSDAQDITRTLGQDVTTFAQQAESWPSTEDLVDRLTDAERDLSDLRAEFAKLRDDVTSVPLGDGDVDRDGLTRLLNRNGGGPVLERLANGERPFIVAMFAIDNLDPINARYGRAVGDNILNALATTLRQTFETDDLMRWSGNGFVVATAELSSAAARLVTEDVLGSFAARRFKLRGTGEWIGAVTASAGIAMGNPAELGPALDLAKRNMEKALENGGNAAWS
jgi:diguanylate cyclase